MALQYAFHPHGVDINYSPSPLFSHSFAEFIQFCRIYELEKYDLERCRLMWLWDTPAFISACGLYTVMVIY